MESKTEGASPFPEAGAGGWEIFRHRHRLLVNVAVHSCLFAVALLAAYLVRMDAGRPSERTWEWLGNDFLPWLPYFVLVKLLIFGRMRLLRGGWQYSSIRDVMSILLASWLFVLVTIVLRILFVTAPMYYLRRFAFDVGGHTVDVTGFFASYSQGVLVLDFLATVFVVSTVRLSFRLYREEYHRPAAEGLRRVLVVGAGNTAEAVVREIIRMPTRRPAAASPAQDAEARQNREVVALVDDDSAKKGIFIHGVPVMGTTQDIPDLCQELKIDEIIIAIPSATQKHLRRVTDLCTGSGVKSIKVLPGVSELVEGRVTVSQIRPVDIKDLLGREAVQLDTEAIARFLRGRRVLVTGAGGSIGSEMCRQICKFSPARLILVEQAETPLFDIENELTAAFPRTPLDGIICDISDRDRVMQVWREFRPEVVIHAAAHKHVPMMERNPGEAVKNNVLGTRNVADASCEVGCGEFVTISTDKAVNPSSVMGATKRVAEMYTQSLTGSGACRTQFKAVRFGNVLDSAGSVVPTFRRQIAAGGPVTVTHPDMTRYFMTISEASQLVLQAAATGLGGQIFLLDMGEPVKIVDLARTMITLSGFRPDEDIDIVFTGVRPGEKLFEELRIVGEDIAATVHPKVLIWKRKPEDHRKVVEAIGELAAAAAGSRREDVVAALRKIVPEYSPTAAGNGRPAGPASEPAEAGAKTAH